ncbi:unnamed protein product [Acanthoscelides obtectus]|uniref:Importin N-terminal domain-containing protein n=1 Tax=Acanthoscelides obtectus TaxID=200917 RepID=A0A9P0MIC7_ACAOB|nr:unnamed protein product [Acanthoscelides obtectus]CAK1673541.1 Transportin-3 [Acanthoscelides obtectus]
MEQKPATDIVLSAISTLYNNPNRSEKEQASQWLLQLQKSVHAWTVADELLQAKKDVESCYFAAQTMRTKIHQSFHELPLEVHTSLRDSLLNHVSQITEAASTVVVTQLCLALADLILQLPSWQKPALDLITRFSQNHIWPLLEVLTVLPEELETRSVRLGENRRMEVLDDMKFCAPTVSEFLKHCCNMYGTNWHDHIQVNVKILRCFTSWISIGAISLNDIADHMIINRAFEILNFKPQNEKETLAGAFHEAATDCICTLLHCLEDNNNQMELENFLFNNIVNLEVPYHMSVANEDQGKAMDYCRLFTELAETMLEKIVSQSSPKQMHYATKVLDLVLICVGHHDYEVAEITFNLWYVLSEELYQRNNKEITELFRPYIERLITALCRHCQMEPDYEGLLDDGDEFKDFRLKVSDLIKDIVFIVGSSSCFRQMFMSLQEPGVTWEVSEAALFIMQAVAKNVLPSENEVVPKVAEAILSIPENTHIAVRYTSVLLLGELCEWIEKHPDTLDPVLNFLVCCLPHAGLLKGVAAIMGKVSHNDISAAVRELCFMQLKPLSELIEQNIVPVRGTKTDPVLWLDRLGAIFKFIKVNLREGEPHPLKPVILEVWPILSQAFDKFQNDIRIMERCCRSVRFMLRSASLQVREILDSLVSQMIRIYASYPHSCFLYVGSILVDEYATEPDCVPGLLDMLHAFLEPTFQLLRVENGLRNHPDTVDDFFRLCARFMQRAPIPFLKSSSLIPILQCALMASTLDHKEANMSVMKFFYDLIDKGQANKLQPDYQERRSLIERLLDEYGQQLVTNLIHSCIFYLHSYMLSEVADVILQLLDFNRDTTSKWLANGLDSLPKHNNGGLMTATPQQLNDIHATIVQAHTSKAVTHALKDLLTLYR